MSHFVPTKKMNFAQMLHFVPMKKMSTSDVTFCSHLTKMYFAQMSHFLPKLTGMDLEINTLRIRINSCKSKLNDNSVV